MNSKYELSQAIAIFRTLKINDAFYGNISNAELSFLVVIYNLGKKAVASMLKVYFNCSKVYVSKIVKKLVDGGYLEVNVGSRDRRLNELTITDKGIEVVKKNMNIYMEKTNYLFDKLGEEKAVKLTELLKEANAILKK